MKNFIINTIKLLGVLLVIIALGFAIGIVNEQDHIDNQAYSIDHECVEFISFIETDEFGDTYINEQYYYSDGTVIENHDYLRIEF